MSDKVDALVIFGATGDLAKIETFPALVGLVERGVLDVPGIGVAKSGWGLAQFRDYATAPLKLNKTDPARAAAPDASRVASGQVGGVPRAPVHPGGPQGLFGRIAQGTSQAGRAKNSRVM